MSQTITSFSSISESLESSYASGIQPHTLVIKEIETPTAATPILTTLLAALYPYLTWSTLWFSLLCLFAAFNMKNLPFMWHLRIVNAFRHIIHTQRPRVPLGPAHIFQPLITSSQAQLLEIDFNIHKTNSSYFSDVDIARTHLVCTLFGEGISRMRGGTYAYTGSSMPMFGFALGAVSCSFRREIHPYQQYEMWSKILSWDEKWVYIVTHFVKKGAVMPTRSSLYPQQCVQQKHQQQPAAEQEEEDLGGLLKKGARTVSGLSTASSTDSLMTTGVPGAPINSKHLYATALSKGVFKSGRKTVAPELMLELSGLLPPADGGEKAGTAAASMTRSEVEAERLRGLEVARSMAQAQNQQDLEAEFSGDQDDEVLGRHTDGSGLPLVMATLFELATTRGRQLL